MVKLNSQKLDNSFRILYSLSRKNRNETILFWLFLDSNRIIDYKNFISLIPPSKNIGIIMRSKSLKNYYNEAKIILKLCKKVIQEITEYIIDDQKNNAASLKNLRTL